MTIVDAHLHLWDPSLLDYDWLEGRLLRPHGVDELAAADFEGGVVERIFVQAECRPDQARAEVAWVSALAARAAIVGIVAYAPLEQGPDAAAGLLGEYAVHPGVVGVRRLLQGEAAGFTASSEFRASARRLAEHGLVFDACVVPDQLGEVTTLADAVPELSIVLDHLGKPAAAAAPTEAWATAIAELAQRPNVAVKLSGLPAEAGEGWTAAQMHPYLDVCLDAFGGDRLIYGSDWPVSEPMPRWRTAVTEWAMDRLGADGAAAALGGNARRLYGV